MHQISTGLPKGKLEQVDTCKGCTLGKYAKYSFQDRDSKVGAVLERVHTDVCGPFSTASTAKQRYYVIFIDDFSRNAGSISCRRRIKPYQGFVSSKPWLRKNQERR